MGDTKPEIARLDEFGNEIISQGNDTDSLSKDCQSYQNPTLLGSNLESQENPLPQGTNITVSEADNSE